MSLPLDREIARTLKRIRTDHPELLKKIRYSGTFPLRVEGQLVTGPRMAALNKSYRGKNYDTDVLSFPAPALFQERGVLGELVISKKKLKEQAREQGHSESSELRVLVVHGVLHLLGLDHELGPRQAARMRKYELAIVGRAGLIERAKK